MTTVLRRSKSGLLPLVLLIGIFLVVNFLTGTRYPTVWVDEALYTDPAANVYFGRGFTSAAWPGQRYGDFWAGNVPLHQTLLTGWFRLFGFSLLTARSMNYVLMATAAMVLWTCSRHKLQMRTPLFATLGIAAILCANGVTMAYRSARPDAIAILLASLAFMAMLISENRRRYFILGLLGIFFPLAGIQLVIFTMVFAVTVVIFTRGNHFREFSCLGLGILLGAAALCALYAAHGVLGNFVAGITQYSNLGLKPQPFFQRILRLPEFLAGDKSMVGLGITAVALLLAKRLFAVKIDVRPLTFALIVWIAITMVMVMLGKFPVYYSWMTVIPMAMTLFAAIETVWHSGERKFIGALALAAALVSCLPGLPLKMVVTCSRWYSLDPGAIRNYVRPEANQEGWMLSSYPAYFLLQGRGKVVVLPPYLETATPTEKTKIRLAVVDPKFAPHWIEQVGGRWEAVGEPLTPEWPWLRSSNSPLRATARRLVANPQDEDFRLAIYRREASDIPK